MDEAPADVRPIGRVRSPLTDLALTPRQGDEGAPPAWIDVDPSFGPGLGGLEPGVEPLVLTWS